MANTHACPDVMFIGARGSGEPAEITQNHKRVPYERGMGAPVNYMAGGLGALVDAYGEEMRSLPVIYSADSVSELVPSKAELAAMASAGGLGLGNPAAGVAGLSGAAALYYARHAKPYLASIKLGVSQTIVELETELTACPEIEFVLAGYSQGAMAIHQAELRLEQDGHEDVLDAIGGTLLLGDGDRAPNSAAKSFGGAPRSGEGIQVSLHGIKPRDVVEPETTAEICVANDLVCDFKLRTDVGALAFYENGSHLHSAYKVPPQRNYLDSAVSWLAREMGLTADARPRDLAGSAVPATASALKKCSGPLGYSPKNGGYGLIIEDMRVQRINCKRAAEIGGEFYAGDPMPHGWHCQYPNGASATHCRYRHTHRRFSFIFGGDAGRAK